MWLWFICKNEILSLNIFDHLFLDSGYLCSASLSCFPTAKEWFPMPAVGLWCWLKAVVFLLLPDNYLWLIHTVTQIIALPDCTIVMHLIFLGFFQIRILTVLLHVTSGDCLKLDVKGCTRTLWKISKASWCVCGAGGDSVHSHPGLHLWDLACGACCLRSKIAV